VINRSPASLGDFSSLPSSWVNFLPTGASDVPDLDKLFGGTETVLPDRSTVFRAFHATDPETVRVVLLGQDPYFKPGLADGLAFSQAGDVDKRSALHRIFLNLESDPNRNFIRPKTGDLSKWADDGVLLMNAALTVAENHPRSHLAHWASFTLAVLRNLGNSQQRIAFILLGADAIEIAMPVLTNAPIGSIVRAAHPTAGDPGSERPFRTSHVFSEANEFLPGAPIQWDLS
jgi:uracil-DNA glycosylase